MTLGDRLAQVRAAQKLRQSEFAKELGVSLRAYTNYENDSADLPLKVLKVLHERYGVSMDWLVYAEPKKVDPKLAEFVKELTAGLLQYMNTKRRFIHPRRGAEVAGFWFTKLANKEEIAESELEMLLRLADGEDDE